MKPIHSLQLFYADIVDFREVAGLVLRDAVYAPNLNMPGHWHEYAHVYLVLQGACTDMHRNTAHECPPATLVFIPGGESALELNRRL